MTTNDSYSVIGKYYDDAYAAKKDLVDAPFYLELARRIGGPVPEIACGTGRVLLPIARAGIAIDGVDVSANMLGVLRGHLAAEPAEVQERVAFFEGDMRTMRLERKYALVTIPFRPMQHMYSVADQVAALANAAWHLDEGGLAAFDVFYPKFEMLDTTIGGEIPELEWRRASDPEKLVRRYFRKDRVDKIEQIFECTFVFRTFDGDRLAAEESEAVKLSHYTYPHLRALFLLAGLEPVEEYGSFAKTPLDNAAQEMIFVLREWGARGRVNGSTLVWCRIAAMQSPCRLNRNSSQFGDYEPKKSAMIALAFSGPVISRQRG
jgi:SAM-dependent methyltransferase